jgi:hypothetical protein
MEKAPKKAAKKAVAPEGATVDFKATVPESLYVAVKNISNRLINTSKGSINPGETGEASVAEARQLNKYIEKI